MPGFTPPPVGVRFVLAGLCLGFAARPGVAEPADPAAAAERAAEAGRWDQALDGYLKLYLAGRQTADVRDRIRDCLRHVSQTRRHRDPAFQQFVVSLPLADALNLYADAIATLAAHHADREASTPAGLFRRGLEECERAVADPAFRSRHLANVPAERLTALQNTLEAARHTKPGTPRDARRAVREIASVGAANPSAVVLEFLCGACTGLDESTAYLTPAQAEVAAAVAEFAAYGLHVAVRDGVVTVDDVRPDSWAASATLVRKGDRLTRLNGRPLPGPAGLAEAAKGFADAAHEIVAEPADGGEPTVTRLPVPAPTVYGEDMPNVRDGVGYVRVGTFAEGTPRELDLAVARLRRAGMRALVLDLRGNPGGLFTAGVDVARRFLPTGMVVSTTGQAADVANRAFAADPGAYSYDFPVVLVLDTRTMSAAEVVAAALKDHGRAVLVGMPSYGKGTVQSPFKLAPADRPGGVVVVTIARAVSPAGTPLHGAGVLPHVLEPDPLRQLDVAVARAAEAAMGQPMP